MRIMTLIFVLAATGFAGAAYAQSTPGVVVQGSDGVSIGGHSAARQGDVTTNGVIVEGSKDVFINGKPAAIGGSKTDCNGVVVGGGGGVFINGKPAVRSGDQTSGCSR